ncbi:MAG TPA: cysteine desulfurase, partial [Beijerinckiaceae bacterium]|nr:cysteine desulfurase [Beijerinckiaceae bacterium]
VPRLANTSLFAIPGLRAETSVIAFDLDGVAVSSGAACSSGKVTKSHVLKAMGVADDLAAAAIRVSFGWTSTLAEVEACLSSLERQLARLRARPLSAA